MKMSGIRARMLLAALLPVMLVGVVLAGVFLIARVGDIAETHSQRVRSLARQLAVASEYGLFSANIGQLQSIATGALREVDVRSVAIFDAEGQLLVQAGQPSSFSVKGLPGQEGQWFDPTTRLELLRQPITTSPIELDDLFDLVVRDEVARPALLGHVMIEFSRETMNRREHEMLLVGVTITLGGLLFGGFLAVHLGQGVIRPVLRVSNMIERIGHGELSARVPLLPDDPLRELQRGLNQMAQRLESGREDLEQRIYMATVELRQKKEEAETATLAKSRFLAAASHDLRQPTHALGMFVARLAQLPHDEETRTLIGHVETSVRATQDLLDALLDISRLEAQAVQVQTRPFALADLFTSLQDALTWKAQSRRLRLRIRPTSVWLLSDPALVYRMVLNLTSNALRYTLQGSVLVTCRLSRDGCHARIEVWDSGIGIAPEHHHNIFKEFYQVANTERDRRKGLGLGLNIVQRTAHLLGHRLQMRSCLGQGTRFSLELPLAPAAVAMKTVNPLEMRALGDLRGMVVLVIEDDVLVREALVSLLESWGVTTHVAEGRASALAQLQQGWVPDVMLSDYRLRDGENGLALIRDLRALAARPVPAALMSGDTDPALMQAAKQAQLTLLHKPVRPAKLRSLIRRLASDAQADGVNLT